MGRVDKVRFLQTVDDKRNGVVVLLSICGFYIT